MFKIVFKTMLITLIIAILWHILEFIFYREIQPRIVDDIISLIYVPFVCRAVESSEKEKVKNESC